MAKVKKKANVTRRPTQHLVLWRTTLDDVPLLLTSDHKEAKKYIASLMLDGSSWSSDMDNSDVVAGHKVMEIGVCSPINLTIVSFRNGRPFRMKIEREIQ